MSEIAKGPIPNTFIVGAPKCGTSALAHYLSEHPNVFFSDPKELFFWCTDYPSLKNEFSLSNISEYLKTFENADVLNHKIVAEGSTRYLRSSNAIRNILSFNHAAKFIAMVRNPVDLVQAYHMEQLFSYEEEVISFEEAWRRQSERQQGKHIPVRCREPAFLQYGEVGKLGDQIERLGSVLSSEQYKVFVFDDFKENTGSVYREALEFLGLPDDARTSFPVINSAHQHKFNWLAKFVLAPPPYMGKTVLKFRQHLIRHRYPTVEWLKNKMTKRQVRPKLRPEFIAELKEYFAADVLKLSDLLQRDLTHWTK